MKQDNIKYLIPESVSAGIYKIIAPDGHYYIGSTINFKRRITEHFNKLQSGEKVKENKEWQYRYDAHPEWVWTCELVESVEQVKFLDSIEQEHLNIHYNKPLCMNRNPYATRPPSPKGKKRTKESCLKTSIALRGKKQTVKHIAARTIAMKNKTPSNKDKGFKLLFTHNVYGTHLISMPSLVRMFPDLKLGESNLRKVACGILRHHKGWAILTSS